MVSSRRLLFIIPAIFAASAVVDYAFTMWFSGTRENLIQNEFSPLLVYAVKYNALVPFVFITVIFYFASSYLVLHLLMHDAQLFYIASAIIFMISIAHAFGGLSWYLNSNMYSNTMLLMSGITVALAVFFFGWTVKKTNA